MIKNKISLSTTCISVLMMNVAFADTTVSNLFLSSGRIEATGAGVTNNVGIISGDVLFPLYGNENGFLFGDAIGGKGSDNTYLISPGAGYRQVEGNHIWGAYLFGDYEQTSLGANFWNISPGIEWMDYQWDAHLNAYFPISTVESSGPAVFADTLGNNSSVSFQTGTHNQYDMLVSPFAVIGDGFDAEVGYSFDDGNGFRSRLYGGGYYYQSPADTNVNNILGVTAGFSQALSKNLTLSLFNSYDQVTNYNVGVSVSVTFGGETNIYSHDVHKRLFDTVERHVGIIDTGAANYDQQITEDDGIALQYSNVYFVSEEGQGDGTNGNPMSLTQANLDMANTENPAGARLYIQGSSTYTIDSSTGKTEIIDGEPESGLFVYDGQDFYGRSTDYTAPASATEQPLIRVDGAEGYNGFIIQDSEENTFSDLNITSFSLGENVGIMDTNNLVDDSVLTIENISISQFATGLSVTNNSTRGNFIVNVSDSAFNHNTSATKANGMNVTNNESGTMTVNVMNSQFNDNSATASTAIGAIGASATNSGTGTLIFNATNSQFNGNNMIYTGMASGVAAGVYVTNASSGNLVFSATNSSFDNNVATGSNSGAYGAEIINTTGNLDVNVVNSTFNNNTTDSLSDVGAGMVVANTDTGTLTVSATQSQFNDNSFIGLYAWNSSTTGVLKVNNLTNSSFENNIYGIYASSSSLDASFTTINYLNTTFSGNIVNVDSSGEVTLIG